jgi:hemolysin D
MPGGIKCCPRMRTGYEGGVVTEVQQLMQTAPDEEFLEVQVMLENKDVGLVREGMPAEIKVQTFPFTKYGVIE